MSKIHFKIRCSSRLSLRPWTFDLLNKGQLTITTPQPWGPGCSLHYPLSSDSFLKGLLRKTIWQHYRLPTLKWTSKSLAQASTNREGPGKLVLPTKPLPLYLQKSTYITKCIGKMSWSSQSIGTYAYSQTGTVQRTVAYYKIVQFVTKRLSPLILSLYSPTNPAFT